MKKMKFMRRSTEISDEALAAYLDGMLSDSDAARIDSLMDIETFEILNVSRKAVSEFRQDNHVSLPSWNEVKITTIHNVKEPLAMAGFLGSDVSDDENIN